jgi:hypothetical protein
MNHHEYLKRGGAASCNVNGCCLCKKLQLLSAARDFTVVDEGLQFSTGKNLQDKHKCNSGNIANLVCLAISHCNF